MSPPDSDAAAVAQAMAGQGGSLDGLEQIDAETAELNYSELRKRERPFVMPLDPANPDRGRARRLRRRLQGRDRRPDALSVAQARLLPDPLGGAGRADPERRHRRRRVCAACSPSSSSGSAATGPGSRPASCSWCSTRSTGSLRAAPAASSKWGNVFDHGIDLIHPPFWWWAWAPRPAGLRHAARAGLFDDAAVGDRRRLCRAADHRGHLHAPLRQDAHPRLAADRQQVPADHRAPQPEHGHPGRRAAVRPARRRASSWSRCGRWSR